MLLILVDNNSFIFPLKICNIKEFLQHNFCPNVDADVNFIEHRKSKTTTHDSVHYEP